MSRKRIDIWSIRERASPTPLGWGSPYSTEEQFRERIIQKLLSNSKSKTGAILISDLERVFFPGEFNEALRRKIRATTGADR